MGRSFGVSVTTRNPLSVTSQTRGKSHCGLGPTLRELFRLLVVFPWTIGFLRDYPDVSNTRMAAPNSSLATEMQNVLSEATKNLENPPEFKKNLPKFKGVFEKLHNLRTNKMP
ncbi:hemoglobin subunit beta-like isoform X1 [Pleurodeles waltl]|uniref:hemoglobin subunit beta-like isoform X1 n=1 Tax=Pleurodeles waltl TaxID=8319 RepID=UPI003709A09D